MATQPRKRDAIIRVMVTKDEKHELRKAADKAAMPFSIYVRVRALQAARDDMKAA
jgi:hypothetical protein